MKTKTNKKVMKTNSRIKIILVIIKVSKGGYDGIKFISELRNKQVNPDLFTERSGL